jgi:hypothetical protein
MSEQDVPSVFDEVEDEVVQRTLVDWKLFNSEKELVSLDDLGEGKPFCSVTGYLIKPLPRSVKRKVCDNLCTFGVSKEGVAKEEIVIQERVVKETMLLQWDTLRVGDSLDGYW